jgi:hypothetical protein
MADSSSDSDDSTNGPDYTLIFKAATFLQKDLDGLIQRFVDRHAAAFSSDAPAQSIEHKEHTLEDTLLHRDFVTEFETMLEKYIEEECSKMSKQAAMQLFFEGARDTMEGRFQPLFMEEEDPNREFVESLLAVSDYEHFFNMLAQAKRRTSTVASTVAASTSSFEGKTQVLQENSSGSSKQQHK